MEQSSCDQFAIQVQLCDEVLFSCEGALGDCELDQRSTDESKSRQYVRHASCILQVHTQLLTDHFVQLPTLLPQHDTSSTQLHQPRQSEHKHSTQSANGRITTTGPSARLHLEPATLRLLSPTSDAAILPARRKPPRRKHKSRPRSLCSNNGDTS